MSSSLVKFANRGSQDGQALWWGRADIDGAPYRGPLMPTLESEEAEDRLVRVCDPKNRIFDLSDDKDNHAYLAVLDMVYNKWAMQTYVKRVVFRNKKTGRIRVEVYMEWVEYYMQDGQPMHSQRPYIGRPND